MFISIIDWSLVYASYSSVKLNTNKLLLLTGDFNTQHHARKIHDWRQSWESVIEKF